MMPAAHGDYCPGISTISVPCNLPNLDSEQFFERDFGVRARVRGERKIQRRDLDSSERGAHWRNQKGVWPIRQSEHRWRRAARYSREDFATCQGKCRRPDVVDTGPCAWKHGGRKNAAVVERFGCCGWTRRRKGRAAQFVVTYAATSVFGDICRPNWRPSGPPAACARPLPSTMGSPLANVSRTAGGSCVDARMLRQRPARLRGFFSNLGGGVAGTTGAKTSGHRGFHFFAPDICRRPVARLDGTSGSRPR